MQKQESKVLVMMRGPPGSGKSTKAKKIAGQSGLVYSTDDFFYNKNGVYQFDPSLIGKNHQQNLNRTIKAMLQSKPLIIIDNTNIKLWEMKKYVLEADKHGYQVKIQIPDTNWAWKAKQCAKKNSHGVPVESIQRMIQNYQNAKQNFRRNPKNK